LNHCTIAKASIIQHRAYGVDTADFCTPENNNMATFPIHTHDQRAVLGVAFSFLFLAVLAVVLRLIAHKIAHKRWTPADYLIIAACVRSPDFATVITADRI
jgi:hypothetical protein